MGYDVPQSSTSHPLYFLMVDSTDHITGKTGLTPTVKIGKAGGTGAAPSGAVTETDSTNLPGWYQVAGNATDTDTLGPLLLHATGTGADPTDEAYLVKPAGSFTPAQAGDAMALTSGQLRIKKNAALNAFTFTMRQSSDHVSLMTTATVTAERSIDGAAYAACANAVSFIGSGAFKIDLAATDLNGDVISLLFTATGADPVVFTIVTNP